jgi:DMSO reductase anchor subunit
LVVLCETNLISQRSDTICQIKSKRVTVLFLHLFTQLNVSAVTDSLRRGVQDPAEMRQFTVQFVVARQTWAANVAVSCCGARRVMTNSSQYTTACALVHRYGTHRHYCSLLWSWGACLIHSVTTVPFRLQQCKILLVYENKIATTSRKICMMPHWWFRSSHQHSQVRPSLHWNKGCRTPMVLVQQLWRG